MPYASDAQRRYFNANRDELEAEGVDVGEWNASSKGKDLPEKVKESGAFNLGQLVKQSLGGMGGGLGAIPPLPGWMKPKPTLEAGGPAPSRRPALAANPFTGPPPVAAPEPRSAVTPPVAAPKPAAQPPVAQPPVAAPKPQPAVTPPVAAPKPTATAPPVAASKPTATAPPVAAPKPAKPPVAASKPAAPKPVAAPSVAIPPPPAATAPSVAAPKPTAKQPTAKQPQPEKKKVPKTVGDVGGLKAPHMSGNQQNRLNSLRLADPSTATVLKAMQAGPKRNIKVYNSMGRSGPPGLPPELQARVDRKAARRRSAYGGLSAFSSSRRVRALQAANRRARNADQQTNQSQQGPTPSVQRMINRFKTLTPRQRAHYGAKGYDLSKFGEAFELGVMVKLSLRTVADTTVSVKVPKIPVTATHREGTVKGIGAKTACGPMKNKGSYSTTKSMKSGKYKTSKPNWKPKSAGAEIAMRVKASLDKEELAGILTILTGGAVAGAGVGGLAGSLVGRGRGNTPEGLGRGILRGGATGLGVMGGHLAGRALGEHTGQEGKMWPGLLGAGLGGLAGYFGSGAAMGQPAGAAA